VNLRPRSTERIREGSPSISSISSERIPDLQHFQLTMKKVHLMVGVLLVIAFLLTGQYMDKFHNHLVNMPDGPRMLYRTRHIFILLTGLLNLVIAAYFTLRSKTWRRTLQVVGSGLIFTAGILFIVAFFYEPGFINLYTPLSHWGVEAIIAGTVFHLLSGAGEKCDRGR
jgi:hypothetical protein